MRLVHAAEVFVGAEHHNLLVDGAVGLGSLETLDGVVEHGVRWLELERLVWPDLGCLPATIVKIIIDLEHIVCLEGTECVNMVCRGLRLELLALDELQVISEECFLHSGEATASGEEARHASRHRPSQGRVSKVECRSHLIMVNLTTQYF